MITYPRELYSYRIRECTFELVEGAAINRTSDGRAVSAVDHFDPWIRASFTTPPLSREDRRGWLAWKQSLRGGLKSFLAYDVSRRFPSFYPNGVPEIEAGTWDGEATVTELSAYEIGVDGAPSGFTLMPGDPVGLVLDGVYGVFTVTEQVVSGFAESGESEMVIPVAPFVPSTVFTIGSTAVLYRPKARFILDPESWEDSGGIDFTPISFVGLQVY